MKVILITVAYLHIFVKYKFLLIGFIISGKYFEYKKLNTLSQTSATNQRFNMNRNNHQKTLQFSISVQMEEAIIVKF